MHLSKRALGFIEGQGPKQGRSHRSDWMRWDGLGEEQGMGLVEGLSVAVLDPGHRTPPPRAAPSQQAPATTSPSRQCLWWGQGGSAVAWSPWRCPLSQSPGLLDTHLSSSRPRLDWHTQVLWATDPQAGAGAGVNTTCDRLLSQDRWELPWGSCCPSRE